MFSLIKISNAKMTFFFITNIVIVSELVSHYLKGTEIFSHSWLYSAFAFLIAYIVYILFIEDIKVIETTNIQLKQHTTNVVRYSTLFFISHVLTNYFEYGTISLSFVWLMRTVLIISGYSISDFIFANKIIKFNKYETLLYNSTKMFCSDVIINLLLYNEMTTVKLIDNVAFICGNISWEIFTKNLL